MANTKSILHAYTNYVPNIRTQSLFPIIWTLSMLTVCAHYRDSEKDFVSFFRWYHNIQNVVTSSSSFRLVPLKSAEV